PFARGPERGARAGNITVVFAQIYKTKRGHYITEFSMGVENPNSLKEGELTKHYVHFLEEVIRKYPDMWLWSHRRWKRDWKPEYKENWIGDTPPPSAQA
ncbi:MAG: lipid A biosynthesis acyltransferase, partial [Chitinophagaceae bacterium]